MSNLSVRIFLLIFTFILIISFLVGCKCYSATSKSIIGLWSSQQKNKEICEMIFTDNGTFYHIYRTNSNSLSLGKVGTYKVSGDRIELCYPDGRPNLFENNNLLSPRMERIEAGFTLSNDSLVIDSMFFKRNYFLHKNK
jgi:hypothetical protein